VTRQIEIENSGFVRICENRIESYGILRNSVRSVPTVSYVAYRFALFLPVYAHKIELVEKFADGPVQKK
jgi:hypothetical protein